VNENLKIFFDCQHQFPD